MTLADPFPVVRTETGWRCPGFAEAHQAKCRTPEWKAAVVVFEKYRRSLGLGHAHLVELRDYAVDTSKWRQDSGKPHHRDILIQAVSAYCKRFFGKTNTQETP